MRWKKVKLKKKKKASDKKLGVVGSNYKNRGGKKIKKNWNGIKIK